MMDLVAKALLVVLAVVWLAVMARHSRDDIRRRRWEALVASDPYQRLAVQLNLFARRLGEQLLPSMRQAAAAMEAMARAWKVDADA